MSITFTGSAVDTFVASSLRTGLRMYAQCGMRPNRQWSPSAMLARAGQITGKTFKRGDYAGAIAALSAYIDSAVPGQVQSGEIKSF